ncbi:MAG: DUF2130 domain-containing protein, partial [Planctomycetota bacterium]
MDLVRCPRCATAFELSDALTLELRERLRLELQDDIVQREAELLRQQEDSRKREEDLNKAKLELDAEVNRRTQSRVRELEAKAKAEAEQALEVRLQDLTDAVSKNERDLQQSRELELELRRKQRALEASVLDADLKVQRTLAEERGKIRGDAEARTQESHRLKDLEKDKLIQDLKSSLDDMKRKADQGSTEIQGKVLELDFEEQLRRIFHLDDIQPVPRGIRGADLVQMVRNPAGADCGSIIWETKNTKAWSPGWITKLKDDMAETRASLAILVTVALPEGIARFGQVDGVWVTDPLSALPLAAALRQQLLQLERERQASTGKTVKMEMLYSYLAGNEFKGRVEGIVEAFTSLQDQLQRERRAMEKNWKEREKQIERV